MPGLRRLAGSCQVQTALQLQLALVQLGRLERGVLEQLLAGVLIVQLQDVEQQLSGLPDFMPGGNAGMRDYRRAARDLRS